MKFTDLEGAGRLFDEMPEGTTMPLCQAAEEGNKEDAKIVVP